LRVKQAELTGMEPFVAADPSFPTRIYSEKKMLQEHTVSIYVQTKDVDPICRDYYGLHLDINAGRFPCKVSHTFELVHHNGNPQSAVKEDKENFFTKAEAWGSTRFILKARLASRNNNPYVKDGYVTFKCTFKIVDE
jgi:hypothetical protein